MIFFGRPAKLRLCPDFKEKDMDKHAIAEFFRLEVNGLFDRIEDGEFDKK